MTPAIFGLSGLQLTAAETAFFRDADPVGFILFRRNLADHAQVLALTDSLRDLTGRDDLPILIDQEGGRVARMGPPEWPAFPTGEAFDRLYRRAPSSAIAAARANGVALGAMLREVGITVNCAPLLDVRRAETTDAIGDRALGGNAMQVAALGRATLEGLSAAGVVGVVKHMPGHGRSQLDTHLALPRVTATEAQLGEDLEPFVRLSHAPMAMTAHIVFDAWDAERPATQSAAIIRDVIRGRIGFDGLLMTDDIDMKALTGTAGAKASLAIAAGCDVVLDCWARMDEMEDIARSVPVLGDVGRARLNRAMASVSGDGIDAAEAVATRDALLSLA